MMRMARILHISYIIMIWHSASLCRWDSAQIKTWNGKSIERLSMAEILILWMLGLIVIAIAWGIIDRIVVPIKILAQSLQTPERSKRLEIAVASLLALAIISIVTAATDNSTGEAADLPALLIWAGGLWLVPFRFGAMGHYWLSSLAIAVILILFWVRSPSPSTRAHALTDVLPQQGQHTSTSVTGHGVLFWILLIGLTVAAIARYTSMWNAAALNS